MHLLAAQPGTIGDGTEAVDLGQSPGDIVVLTAADSEISALAAARATLPADFPSVRLANLMRLGHNLSVDLYVDAVVAKAKLVVVRVLGGRAYWPYGVERIVEMADRVAFLPGDDSPDADLAAASTLPPEALHRLWRYLAEGGPDNSLEFLRYCGSLIDAGADWREPRPLLRAGFYGRTPSRHLGVRPVVAVVLYRALVQSGMLAPIDALIAALESRGLAALPVFVTSLKDPLSAATLSTVFAETPPDVILNTTSFAVSTPGAARSDGPFDAADCPVIQVILSGGSVAAWRAGSAGLGPRDIAMNLALPEVDGRIIGRAVSFKGKPRRDPLTEADVVDHEPVPDRVEFVAALAQAWSRLRRKAAEDRRVALVLNNYPNRDGRLGNGVGLDTPASAIVVLEAMAREGYAVVDIPADGDTLIRRMREGPTNDLAALPSRTIRETLSLIDYEAFFSRLPEAVRRAVTDRWGKPEDDPFFKPSPTSCGNFSIAVFRCGTVAVGLQPARGYNIDPASSYHDPALVPPHAYFAFYAWIADHFRADAVVHLGKHGNLEWLPGKSVALSADCFPEAALGPMPHLYPFIVNDPGEGTQAKRRAQAVIVDHLTPPLTRAESYGSLRDLERLVDEYYEAAGVDARRLKVLKPQILDLCRSSGLAVDCGIETGDSEDAALQKLDGYLCELKELQIRDGLHIFGRAPEGRLLTDLLVALARVPRGRGEGGEASILRALAADLALDFDPLAGDLAAPWSGLKPEALALSTDPWRSAGDTVERLELLASALVSGDRRADPAWMRTRAVLAGIDGSLRPAVDACGRDEIAGLLAGLAGRFVPPGPSGAPTRGRPDVLPTGRNFYSVDTRTVPTPAAWTLGWKSAALLVERYAQDHGGWPRRLGLTAWGTSNMRTGGDDIAQALALLGVRPTWDSASRRVTGFEVLPVSVLGRPRVDVTLRISGFFRDAFPGLIDLFDSAVRAVAALDEPEADNPVAARVRAETAELVASGLSEDAARRRAGFRVFGSKPGAYGAGLQALIDEKGWQSDADLARAYVAWGGYAYGAGAGGEAAHGLFETRLKGVQVVLQNQDNREHDLLDSDDYYQFEGGMTAAVRQVSGDQPVVYHGDNSRPETPAVRTLEEEIARVVRARAANPKWIAGCRRHGYKGAFEMAATVDYLFAFAATARCVRDHHFDLVYDAYLGDPEVRRFIEEHNPAALKEMGARFQEAIDRRLWKPRLNSVHGVLTKLAGVGTVGTP
jgi:cobaltochelatase CobN